MYEPIRTKSVHSTMAGTTADFPHRSREEELDIQLAGHLAALLAVTDELRALAPGTDLDTAADRLAEQVTRLRGGQAPVRVPVTLSMCIRDRDGRARRGPGAARTRVPLSPPGSPDGPGPRAPAATRGPGALHFRPGVSG